MDPEFALLLLESDLLHKTEFSVQDLSQYREAVTTAATTEEGYSGLAWKAGAKLLEVAFELGENRDGIFESFGWEALANGLQAAIQDRKLLSALSYASVPFLPPPDSPPIFDHPWIVDAIREGLVNSPRSFIKPSELGAADETVQTEFGELLSQLLNLEADNELILQWSACALRVLPTHSFHHQVGSVNLLQALCSENRIATAYYAFRALVEHHESLWTHPVALTVLRSFVDQYWEEEVGIEALVQLCADDDVLRRCDDQFDLLVLIGALAIRLSRQYDYQETNAAAWHLVNEMYSYSPLVAHALTNYLTNGALPPLPDSKVAQVETLQHEFDQAVARVKNELRPRSYAQLALAGKIYQSNVREVFTPFLTQIQSKPLSPTFVDRIQEIDPEKLVTESELQKSSTHPIDGRMLRKMVADNRRILKALNSAARKRVELNRVKEEWATQASDELEFFQEVELLIEDLNSTAEWTLMTLLSDLWTRFQEGIAIAAREREVRVYATR